MIVSMGTQQAIAQVKIGQQVHSYHIYRFLQKINETLIITLSVKKNVLSQGLTLIFRSPCHNKPSSMRMQILPDLHHLRIAAYSKVSD